MSLVCSALTDLWLCIVLAIKQQQQNECIFNHFEFLCIRNKKRLNVIVFCLVWCLFNVFVCFNLYLCSSWNKHKNKEIVFYIYFFVCVFCFFVVLFYVSIHDETNTQKCFDLFCLNHVHSPASYIHDTTFYCCGGSVVACCFFLYFFVFIVFSFEWMHILEWILHILREWGDVSGAWSMIWVQKQLRCPAEGQLSS